MPVPLLNQAFLQLPSGLSATSSVHANPPPEGYIKDYGLRKFATVKEGETVEINFQLRRGLELKGGC